MRKIIFFVMMMFAVWGNAQSWTEQTSSLSTSISNVFFINDSVGWTSGIVNTAVAAPKIKSVEPSI